MGCSEHVEHYRTGPRAGLEQIAENFGAAFLPMRASNREAGKIPRRPPLAPNDRPGCAGQRPKKGLPEPKPGDEDYNIGAREEPGGFAAGQ